jgi:ATP-dependent DNA helicase PIF1
MTEPDAPKRPAPRRWTEEEDAQLSANFRHMEGPLPARIKQLAAQHNRTEGAIQSRLNLLDLLDYGPYTALIKGEGPDPSDTTNVGKAYTEEETAALLVAHHTHQPLEELAERFHRSPRALAIKLVHLGVVNPTINPNPKPAPRKYPKPKTEPLLAAKPASTATLKIQITPEFQTALTTIQNGENLLILGSAGTGKSTFLKWLRKNLDTAKKRYAVLAPTGMAAHNVGGQTIHSFFAMKPQLQAGAQIPKPRNPKLYANLDLLVVDEISMVRADVFEMMDRFLRKYGPKGKQPFGGVQMVLLGDLCQLPPVVRREEQSIFETTYANPFFFGAEPWRQGNFSTVRFSHIFRQSDGPFINLLNAVRHNMVSPQQLAALNARLTTTPPQGAVVLAARNAAVDTINQRELAKLSGQPRTYTAEVLGTVDAGAFTTPAELTLKPGARVMFTRNSKTMQWVNGTLGTVERLSDDFITVRTENGLVHVEPEKWESIRYQFSEGQQAPVASVSGSFTQYPLALAWALTIHKAQGQTLPQCVIDLADGGTFAEGQLYVALSRARSLESLHLTTPITHRHIKTHPAVMAFYEALEQATALPQTA